MALVVGYIPTKEGRAAIARAAEEAQLRDTAIVVVNTTKAHRSDTPTEVGADVDAVVADLASQGLDVSARHLVRGNEPAEDLIAVAQEIGAELIIIGLRRRTPVGKLILGSNAQRILLDAPCPVLAVKADG